MASRSYAAGTTRFHAATNGIVEIITSSIDKGQFPLVLFAGLYAFMIWRMPPEDVTKLVMKLLDLIVTGAILGWSLWIITLISGFALITWLRRVHSDEVARIATSRNYYQDKLLSGAIVSSNPSVRTGGRKALKK